MKIIQSWKDKLNLPNFFENPFCFVGVSAILVFAGMIFMAILALSFGKGWKI